MTSDAKVGVFLGLIFIFIIAFLINGLPNLMGDRNNSELTMNMVSSQNKSPGLGSTERKITRDVINRIEPTRQQDAVEVWKRSMAEDNIRFTSPLPEVVGQVERTAKTKEPLEESQTVVAKQFSESEVENQEDKDKQVVKITAIKPASARIYVVQQGDSLASIAKEVYGPEEGNRLVNVKRIFRANRDNLESADKVLQGQKLIIPSLQDSRKSGSDTSSVLSSSMVKKVKSIGERHLSSGKEQTDAEKWYVVQKGDNLWKIAQKELGDGLRYKQIVKMNNESLSDEDNLYVGMRLKLPGR